MSVLELWRGVHPNPGPSTNPLWRKCYLWVISLAGAGISVAVLAAALAPSPGNHLQPLGGILGTVGLLFSVWVGWYAHCVPMDWGYTGTPPIGIERARERIRTRERSRKLFLKDPQLASELGIGRPDLLRTFDDGGLVDVNQVPASSLSSLPGVDVQLAERIVALRQDVGGFSSANEVEFDIGSPARTARPCSRVHDLSVEVGRGAGRRSEVR